MLLVIDAGNTQTVVGLYGGEELLDHWRIATNAERTSDEHALLIGQFLQLHGFSFDEGIKGVAISSGVPRVTGALRDMAERYFGFSALVVEPPSVIGRSTVESIQSGVIYGVTGMVDGICRRIMDELGEAAVVATGGLSALIAPLSACIQHEEPWLTLHGLRLIYEKNASA